jgi:hydrogenase 3 maturation protease
MHKLCDASGDVEARLRSELEVLAGDDRVFVLGLGNLDRADDGAGVLVAHALKKSFPGFSFSEHDGVEGTVLDISETPGRGTVFFVDAANIGSPPGTIRVMRREDINDKEITTHRVTVALMAALLERGGRRSAVVCIQPERIEFREPVTEPVQKAVDTVVSALSSIMAERD